MTKTSRSENPALSYCSCPNCGQDMGKTYDEDEKDLPACPICGTQIKFSQNKKFEKIEKMAWELYQKMQVLTDELFFKDRDNKDTRFKDFYSENNLSMMKIAWSRAEKFYNMAKQKQKEANDGDA